MGLVTGPHAYTPRTRSQWEAGPGRTPQGRGVRRWWAPNQGRTTLTQERPARGRSSAAPTARKASSQERALWGW